jgi:hypothetical protein
MDLYRPVTAPFPASLQDGFTFYHHQTLRVWLISNVPAGTDEAATQVFGAGFDRVFAKKYLGTRDFNNARDRTRLLPARSLKSRSQ